MIFIIFNFLLLKKRILFSRRIREFGTENTKTMKDNKMAAVLLLFTICNELLTISCQDDGLDCTDYDMRKPPRFGKRSTFSKYSYGPCPENPVSKKMEEQSIDSLKSLLNQLKKRIKKEQNEYNPYRIDKY
jgi:hypothetical protein